MEEQEIELRGGTHGRVVRVGDTVRRSPGASATAVHALLVNLEAVGFAGAPRFLGMDGDGREMLSFLPGEVAVRRDPDPLPEYARSDATLERLGQLIRTLHDATVGFEPPEGAEWSFLEGAPREGHVICHNDIGPWNTVFVDGEPVAFIDWGGAAPSPRIWDVAYAIYRFAPFVPDEVCTILGWTEPPDRLGRTQLLCEAYGIETDHVLGTIERRIELMIATGEGGNAEDDPRFGDFWMNVMRLRLVRDLDFVRSFSG